LDYRVRVSPRAKNVRLKVSRQQGLEVIVPRGYDLDKVPGLLERKKRWVGEALERAAKLRKFFEPKPQWRLPTHVKFPATGVVWHVASKETDVSWVAARELGNGRLLIFGNIGDEKECRAALTRWLMRKTRAYLIPQLRSVSEKTHLRFKRVFVRRQRTRWASCSRHKTISLNAKLLFLPPRLVEYVMIHELCHIAVMNHSKDFWGLVQRHCPGFRERDAQLREMWKVVPRWAMSD
jgi:predicted metal-dependent hydrolase